jgi:hypothetical protein
LFESDLKRNRRLSGIYSKLNWRAQHIRHKSIVFSTETKEIWVTILTSWIFKTFILYPFHDFQCSGDLYLSARTLRSKMSVVKDKVWITNTLEIFSPFSSFVYQIDRTHLNPAFNFGFCASLLHLSVVSRSLKQKQARTSSIKRSLHEATVKYWHINPALNLKH